MNRRAIISECAIEIGTYVSCEIIYPKRIIQNVNQLLDALPSRGVIVGLYIGFQQRERDVILCWQYMPCNL
jgi:hypothetical protein